KEPRYPFGFGLSYTQFRISELSVKTSEVSETSEVLVSVKVRNTGARAGAEVAQLYIGFPPSTIDRPEKLLQGFKKVFLQPGEERTIDFKIPVNDLAYYNPDSEKWVVEKGKYEILIGNSSRDEKMLTGSFD
ncbi:MAG: fibronectin type III-like domain-contianing protein, partial [Bacteroidota bacterium]